MRRTAVALAIAAVLTPGALAQDVGPVISEATIDAPLEAVWTAWTTSEGLRAWLAPHADIDLRVGGLMRTNYSAQGALGDPQTIENTVLSFDPRRMLSIKVTRTPDGFPFPDAVRDMWTVIYFEAAGAARTHLRVVALGFRPDDESQQMRAFFDRGNATTLEQLQRHFAERGR